MVFPPFVPPFFCITIFFEFTILLGTEEPGGAALSSRLCGFDSDPVFTFRVLLQPLLASQGGKGALAVYGSGF